MIADWPSLSTLTRCSAPSRTRREGRARRAARRGRARRGEQLISSRSGWITTAGAPRRASDPRADHADPRPSQRQRRSCLAPAMRRRRDMCGKYSSTRCVYLILDALANMWRKRGIISVDDYMDRNEICAPRLHACVTPADGQAASDAYRPYPSPRRQHLLGAADAEEDGEGRAVQVGPQRCTPPPYRAVASDADARLALAPCFQALVPPGVLAGVRGQDAAVEVPAVSR